MNKNREPYNPIKSYKTLWATLWGTIKGRDEVDVLEFRVWASGVEHRIQGLRF